MKYKKIAKDKKGTILQEGDIIQFKRDDIIPCVIDKIIQRSRDEYPELEVFEVTTDWKGGNVNTKKNVLTQEMYRNCVLVHSNLLSDSIQHTKLKMLAKKAYNRMHFRRRVNI